MGAERGAGTGEGGLDSGRQGMGNKILAVGSFGILFGLPELQSHRDCDIQSQ